MLKFLLVFIRKLLKKLSNIFKKYFFFSARLNKKLNIHPVPKIQIFYDESEKNAAKIEALLYKAKKQSKKINKKSQD
jgi:ribosome-binding factor A